MKVFGIVYLVSMIWFQFKGKLKVSGKQDNEIIHKFIASLFFRLIITICIGLPLLGIISLLGF